MPFRFTDSNHPLVLLQSKERLLLLKHHYVTPLIIHDKHINCFEVLELPLQTQMTAVVKHFTKKIIIVESSKVHLEET